MAKKKVQERIPIRERIQKIVEGWFLSEPALFEIYCTHQLKENPKMACCARTGKGLIEYNPALLQNSKDDFIESVLRIEVLRIMLKHPYERQPEGISDLAKTLGSECTITNYYPEVIVSKVLAMSTPESFDLPKDQYFEWYAREIYKQLQTDKSQQKTDAEDENNPDTKEQTDPESGNSNSTSENGKGKANGGSQYDSESEGKNQDDSNPQQQNDEKESQNEAKSQQSGLWEEDEMKQQEINETISKIKSWGSIPGDMVEMIKASTKPKIDYRKILQGFRASIISSRRSLTRMRPNRRTGFQNMGSIYKFSTSLLVAVDVSGSVNDRTLANFYGVINNAFKYGIERIDVMQFDCDPGEIVEFRKRKNTVEIKGRGGTNFQCVIDTAAEHLPAYDGLIILTDGYAPVPRLPKNFPTKILWVLQDEISYKSKAEGLATTGRVCVMNLG